MRLSLPPHLEVLWPLFRALSRRYPAVTFDVFVTDRRVDLVADGIDVALRVGDRATAGYVGRTLTRYRHRLVASPAFLKAHPIKAPGDLARVPCACWRTSGPRVWHLGNKEVELQPVLVTNDYLHLLRLAELHRGASVPRGTSPPAREARGAVARTPCPNSPCAHSSSPVSRLRHSLCPPLCEVGTPQQGVL
ncbi:MAG: hypothetical protein JNM17_34345 [Archangium sp.]|nr:hypothetical protein [Archangium sp.]